MHRVALHVPPIPTPSPVHNVSPTPVSEKEPSILAALSPRAIPMNRLLTYSGGRYGWQAAVVPGNHSKQDVVYVVNRVKDYFLSLETRTEFKTTVPMGGLQLPDYQTAIIADESGQLVVSDHVALPELRSDEVLIRTAAVAVNPSDVKLTGSMGAPSATAGSDCAGIVVAVGDTASGAFQIGDRVCAPAVPMDPLSPRSGAFAQSGCIPITSCSRKNFALVESYGAEKAFNYHDTDCAAQIKAFTHNALDYALDCVCDATSMAACYQAIGRAGGAYTTLEPYQQQSHVRKRVRPSWLLGTALLGREIGWKPPYHVPADPMLRRFGSDWFQCAQRLLSCGEIRAHPVRIGENAGFQHILEGVELLRRKAVSGEKLVYRIP
ncbi:zinc-binding dehydrogenase family [Seiridium cupressi]